jgi:alpha-ribazole phosphatase
VSGVAPPENAQTRAFLVRHEEPDPRTRGRCIGRLDVRLSARGAERARRLGSWLRSAGITAIYSSPLVRTVQTARAIASTLGLQPVTEPDLREIDFGIFEGMTFEEIERSHPEPYERWMTRPHQMRFPEGESAQQMTDRSVAAVDRLRRLNPGRSFVVVSHGGPIRAVVASSLDMPPWAAPRLAVDRGGVTLLEWTGETPVLRSANVVPADSPP